MTEDLEDYVLSHISPEDAYLHRLWRETNVRLLAGRMASGHLQGRLLRMLVSMISPSLVLEVGTFTGYSAISMAMGLPRGGRLITYEIDDELEPFTRPWIAGSAVASAIDFRIGDGAREAPLLGLTFDVVFLDGDKRRYVEDFEAIRPIVRRGGFVIADNTLWDGHVIDPAYDRDAQTRGIRRFNDMIADDGTIEKVIIPMRDGLTLMRIKS